MPEFLNLAEAARLVPDGATLALAGNVDMSPLELVRELVRQGRRGLRLVLVPSGGLAADLLIGAGAAAAAEFGSLHLGEYGVAPAFKRLVEGGRFRPLDSGCPAVLAGLQAGAQGVPFMPVRGFLGTDYLRVRPEFRVVENPYNPGEPVVVVPAIRPDVAVIHGFRADPRGNVLTDATQDAGLMARASRFTVVTVEEVQERPIDGGAGFIPALYVGAVAAVPGGARPGACPGYYGRDEAEIRAYCELAKTEAGFAEYLNRYVLSAAPRRWA